MKIIIAGGGEQQRFITRSFLSRGYHVTIINENEAECRKLSRAVNAVVVHGTVALPRTLEDAGIRVADRILAVTARDEDNFVICLLARRKYAVPAVFSLVNDPENEPIFRELGIGGTFSISEAVSTLIERQAVSETVLNFRPLSGGKINVTEIVIPENSPALGRTLRDLRLPGGSLLVAVLRNDDVLVPDGSTVLLPEDRVSFLSRPERYAGVLEMLIGKE